MPNQKPRGDGSTWTDRRSGELDRVFVNGDLIGLAFKAREGTVGWALSYVDLAQRPSHVGGVKGGGCLKTADETCSAIPRLATEICRDGSERPKVRVLRGIVRVERRDL